MTIAEFEDCLDRFGEDVSTWPAPQRDRARALARNSAEARALLREAATLRRMIAGKRVAAPAALMRRILSGRIVLRGR